MKTTKVIFFTLIICANIFIFVSQTKAEHPFYYAVKVDQTNYYKQCDEGQYLAGCWGAGDECMYENGDCYDLPDSD